MNRPTGLVLSAFGLQLKESIYLIDEIKKAVMYVGEYDGFYFQDGVISIYIYGNVDDIKEAVEEVLVRIPELKVDISEIYE